MIGFILALIIGGIAGYIASRIMEADFGIIMTVGLGVAGAFIFNLIFGLIFGIEGGNILWQLVAGIVGACALIWGYREYRRRA